MLTATDVKNNLFDIISDISTHPEDFSNNPGSDFSRNRKLGFVGLKMRVKLGDVCERGSSNLKQADVIDKTGDYPIYGAAGYIGNVDFYHQGKPYVAVVKDGAGIGRAMLLPAESSVIGTMQYLLPKDNVLPDYLFYVVKHMHLEKYFSGATIPHIYFRDYRNEEFNLDDLKRQSEIVSTLNQIERVITARQQQIAKLDELIKARFPDFFPLAENHS